MTALQTQEGDNKMKQMTVRRNFKSSRIGNFSENPGKQRNLFGYPYTSRNTESPAGCQQPLLYARKRGG